jgi:PAS domain S-box-containing protein
MPFVLSSSPPGAVSVVSRHTAHARLAFHDILITLCAQLEDDLAGMRAAVYVLHRAGRRWEAMVEPTLPAAWRRLHRSPRGATAGACGAAIARRQTVIVPDIRLDPLYAGGHVPLGRADQGACWAVPLARPGEPVRGVLLLCGRRGRLPRSRESAILARAGELALPLVEGWAGITMVRSTAEPESASGLLAVDGPGEREYLDAAGETARSRADDIDRLGALGSWVMDLRTGLLLWSHEMFRIFGLTPTARTPTVESAWSQVHPEDARRLRSSIERDIQEGREIQGEHRIIRPDGTVAQVRYWGRPVTRRRGEVLEYIGTVQDVTEERRVRHQLRATLEQVRALAVRQLQVRDDERRRIARDIHETTVQKLAALQLNLARLRRAGGESAAGDDMLEECVALAESSITDLRTLSYLLHPPMLDETGLASAVRWYADGFAKRSGLAVGIDVPAEIQRFPHEVEIAVFRLVQEGLINILRHANTDRAAVRLSSQTDRLIVEVQDWGAGMAANDEAVFGVGLSGMRERIEQLGGILEIRSGPDGTTITAVLPVAAP